MGSIKQRDRKTFIAPVKRVWLFSINTYLKILRYETKTKQDVSTNFKDVIAVVLGWTALQWKITACLCRKKLQMIIFL